MNIFKKGDRVRCIADDNNCISIGSEGTITCFDNNMGGRKMAQINWDNYNYNYNDNHYNYNLWIDEIELVSNNNKTMNLKEKFIVAITSEPKKSFRKAHITDGDDLLTEEGQQVFLSWLLHDQYAEAFKKEVVKPLLEEEKKEDK
ncbi:MAG: hypothetical protein ACTSPI_11685 [Candidatus Heimdallarchaeaceae archaeon]